MPTRLKKDGGLVNLSKAERKQYDRDDALVKACNTCLFYEWCKKHLFWTKPSDEKVCENWRKK